MAELRARRDAVVGADLIELRLDTVKDVHVAGALAGRRVPAIVTCRPVWEGGRFEGSEEERRRILEEALTLGAEYVDVEWRASFNDLLARTAGRRIVLSSHDFVSMPTDLVERARAMRATGAEIIKLAATANRLSDCLPLLELGEMMGQEDGLVLIAMGARGLPSRILAKRFRSAWTYVGTMSEIGQVTPADLLQTYCFRRLEASTAIYGVVGSPVGHSISPAMHNAAFEAGKIDAVYVPFDAADADDFVTFGRALKLAGASVTIPFKVSLFDRVDEVDAVAQRIGAINTIRVVDGRWLGGNTDASGFLRPLQEGRVPLEGTRASILGAGGAARAVAIALAPSGAGITVHARKAAQAEAVATIVSGNVGPWPPEPGSWDVLVNCTPIGMHPHVDHSPMPRDSLTGRLVYDLIYNPAITALLRDATSAGCQTIGGLDMLVAQAEDQFHWWTGVRPPASIMRSAALKRLSEFMVDENYVV